MGGTSALKLEHLVVVIGLAACFEVVVQHSVGEFDLVVVFHHGEDDEDKGVLQKGTIYSLEQLEGQFDEILLIHAQMGDDFHEEILDLQVNLGDFPLQYFDDQID